MFHFSRFPRLRGKWVKWVISIKIKETPSDSLSSAFELLSSFCSANPEMFYLLLRSEYWRIYSRGLSFLARSASYTIAVQA